MVQAKGAYQRFRPSSRKRLRSEAPPGPVSRTRVLRDLSHPSTSPPTSLSIPSLLQPSSSTTSRTSPPSTSRRTAWTSAPPPGGGFPHGTQPLSVRGLPIIHPGVDGQHGQRRGDGLGWQGPAKPLRQGGGSEVASALQAAKQVTWRGQGELPQLPWPQPHQGLVLVVDLWAGISGLLVALLALGVRCIALAAE